jgi:hypothetical protein
MTAASRPPTAVPTATPLVIVVTATPIPTPTATATPVGPQKRLDVDATRRVLSSTILASGIQTQVFKQQIAVSKWFREQHTNITENGGINSAVWTSDGRGILISRGGWAGVYGEWGGAWYYKYCDDDSSMSALTQVDTEGGNAADIIRDRWDHKTLSCGGGGPIIRDAIWSPNGNSIAVLRLTPDGQFRPYIISADGKHIKTIDQCGVDFPRFWSVDGKWLIVRPDHATRLIACEVDGNRRVPLEQLGKIQVYDQRYWPWRVTDAPVCKGASFWECE